jgi:hypothetical protein
LPAVPGDDWNQPACRGVKVPFLTRLGVRRGTQGDIMHRISAALACLAVVVTVGCGTAQATTQRHPTPLPCPRANNVITQADSGKTYCVRVGGQVTIILHSTQKNLWREPLASGNVLEGVPNGAASLVEGATGVWYKATRPGRSVVTSVRPPCRAAANSAGTSYPVKSCALKDRFTVTIIAS